MGRTTSSVVFCILISLFSIPTYEGGLPKSKHHRRLPRVSRGEHKVIRATWYQRDGHYVAWHFHGKPGERMFPGCLTAAHPTLPFGYKLRVSRGDKSVLVTINDRGPEPRANSDIDLSREAAKRLGLLRLGRGKVTLED